MSLRILGGEAKSFSLSTPSEQTRPTQVQLKRRIFDRYQDWSDEVFVDLCAGTGSIGLEAWSRGAQSVYLVEADRKAQRLLQGDVKRAGERYPNLGELHLAGLTSERWLPSFKSLYMTWPLEQRQLTTLFLDPPYQMHQIYRDCLQMIVSAEPWFVGRLIVESDRQTGVSEELLQELVGAPGKLFSQGTSYFIVWEMSDEKN